MRDEITDKIVQGFELMNAERYAEAKELFSGIIAIDRRNVEAYLNLGNACMNNGDVDEGIAVFKKALLVDKESTDAIYSLGCAYFVKGDYSNAMKYFNRIEAMGAATPEMYEIMMAMFVDSDEPESAARCINRAIQLEPLNVSLRISKAELYVASGKTEAPINALHELQEVLPDESAGYIMEAEVLLGIDDEENALAALDRAIMRFPEDPSLYATKARALNTQGRYADALECAEKAAAIETDSEAIKQDIVLQRGIALGGVGRVDDSIAILEKSATNDRNAVMAYYTLLNECMLVKQYDKAENYCRQVLELEAEAEDRVLATATFMLALAVQRQGREDEALELYKDVVRSLRRINIQNPGLYEVYAYRALAHTELKEFDKAEELCDHLIALDGGSAATLALKYDVEYAKGDMTEAEKLKARVLKLDPNYRFEANNG